MREEALGLWSGLRLRSLTCFTNTYCLVIIMLGTVASISLMLAHILLIINLWNMYYYCTCRLTGKEHGEQQYKGMSSQSQSLAGAEPGLEHRPLAPESVLVPTELGGR